MGWFKRSKKPSRATALHIDDSKWVRIPVSILLRREFNMRVLEAENGLDGIALAQREIPDLILLDVMMPQMDGYDTLQKLKSHLGTRDIPVVMCTARYNTREVNIALKLGAYDYLPKPIEEERLIAVTRKVMTQIQQKNQPGGSMTVFHDQLPQPVHEMLVPARRPEIYALPGTPVPAAASSRSCPQCQHALDLISQYNAWYCYPCQFYPDFEPR